MAVFVCSRRYDHDLEIYVVGPVLGAIVAVGFEWVLKGKTTAAGTLAAQGDLENAA